MHVALRTRYTDVRMIPFEVRLNRKFSVLVGTWGIFTNSYTLRTQHRARAASPREAIVIAHSGESFYWWKW